jgi:anti-sigma regulatory factor (Ser/Thr protein kinase)
MQPIELTVPARLDHLAPLRAAVARLGPLYAERGVELGADRLYGWGLAVYEAATNVARHGYPEGGEAMLTLAIEPEPERVVFRLIDFGRPIRPWPPSSAPPAPGEGGYGLYLIGRVMDEVHYAPLPGGPNELRMVGLIGPGRS